MSARQEKVREALMQPATDAADHDRRAAALAEVEEWETRLDDALAHAARSLAGWQSGLMHRFTKPATLNWVRGFESYFFRLALSSRGLGHHPFTVDTGVRISIGS